MRKQAGSPHKGEQIPWNILKLLNWTTDYFKKHNVEGARASAELLLAHALGLRRIDLYLRHDQPLNAEELAAFKVLIKRRAAREPVAYILGVKDFWTLELEVTKDVLIPRPETECLVEEALDILPKEGDGQRILELGTGSGAIVLSLLSERPENSYFASDRSLMALKVALGNAKRHDPKGRVSFFSGDWLTPLGHGYPFDLIVSNPPYIPKGEIGGLQEEVSLYEPKTALDGGDDGLDDIGRILFNGHNHLASGGWILLEIGHDQRRGVERLAKEVGAYEEALFRRDYAGRIRVAKLRKKRLRFKKKDGKNTSL